MKICWDNLEKLRYDKEKGCWYNNSYIKLKYNDHCEECREPFLSFYNGSFCSNICSGKSNEAKLKRRESKIGKLHSEETKKKIGKANSQKRRSEKLKQKISEALKGRKLSYSTKQKISVALKGEKNYLWKGGVYKNNIIIYDTYASQLGWCEEVRRDPENQDWLQVKCSYCQKWYSPTTPSVYGRLGVLRGRSSGGHRFYCSEECKQLCPIFNQQLYPKNMKPYSKRDPIYQEWSRMVKERDGYTCQICGSTENLIAHHFEGLNQNDIMSLDLEMGITLCKKCERRAHNELGCRYVDLRKDRICK